MIHISELLTLTARKDASDLHLSSKKPPIMRINGDMIVLEDCPPLSSEQVKTMIYSVMTDFQRSKFEEELELDFALSFTDDLRFRVNAFNTIDGPAAVFRVIPSVIRTLKEINAPQVLSDVINRNKGLVLVTGPTGSGKSTTLAAMLDLINEKELKHIITIEDPIEFVHKSKMSLINQREVGGQTKSFARALKSALREDPDVILVGEMRDLETIQLALTAAETGHLVLGTLHTSSAPKTIDRIVDVFPAGDKDMIRSMLSNSIEAVITQTLLKRKDGQGRIAAFEIMLGIPSVRNLIREGKIAQMYSVMQISGKSGMKIMKDAIYDLVKEDVIDLGDAKTYFTDISETAESENALRQSILNTKKPQGML
jgi:twitching motility protein PilT